MKPFIRVRSNYTALSMHSLYQKEKQIVWDFVVNGNSITLYMDGVSLGTKTFTAPSGLATNGLYFGARHTNAGSGFTDVCPGTYYNMKVYKRALTSDEITSNFSSFRSNYGL